MANTLRVIVAEFKFAERTGSLPLQHAVINQTDFAKSSLCLMLNSTSILKHTRQKANDIAGTKKIKRLNSIFKTL